MIPKIIHYCWFGGKALPKSAEKCIKSWQKYMPGYEIKRWDESNFDINAIDYTRDAYAAGKYAFVSDYARFYVLNRFGGIYFDTDVEVIAPFDDILAAGAYLGREEIGVNPGLGMASEANNPFLNLIIDYYSHLQFKTEGGRMLNIVDHTTGILIQNGYRNEDLFQQCCGFNIYPQEFFCPIDYDTRELKITGNTRTIHHYAESWVPKSTRFKNSLKRLFGQKFINLLIEIKHLFKH